MANYDIYTDYDYHGYETHSDAPLTMHVAYGVNDDGNYIVTFKSSFDSPAQFFNYTWKVYVNDVLVIDIPTYTIGYDANYEYTCSSEDSDTPLSNCGDHFTCVMYCGDPTCEDAGGKEVANINLYSKPTWNNLEITNNTTKSITVTAEWDDGTQDSTAYIDIYNSNNEYILTNTISNSGESVTFSDLTHNSNYTIKAYLKDNKNSYDYNDDGISGLTKKLSVKCTDSSSTINAISTTWKSYVDDNESSDNDIVYDAYNCYLYGDTNYKMIGTNDINNEITTPNRTIINYGLLPYTLYSIFYQISDGYNKVNSIVDIYTDFSYARIKVDGKWHKAIPYIKVDGKWHKAIPNIKVDGKWHITY